MVINRILAIMLLTGLVSSCNYNHPLNNIDEAGNNHAQPAINIPVTVIEYLPMPGQFINTTPPYSEGDNAESMAIKATECLKNGYAISLGTWGGCITLRLGKPIPHRTSGRDFRVIGNAFYHSTSSASGQRYGASEPGIIQVSADDNGDGQPDCWYEIAGSEHDASIMPFSVTYSRTETNTITWRSSDGRSGTIEPNKFHTQPYFPQWITTADLTFTGRRLPDNGYILPNGSFTQRCFEYGYADNQPNASENSIVNLDWAIDNEGNPVELPSISFIRIYTGVFQESTELGECSTEICGIEIPAE